MSGGGGSLFLLLGVLLLLRRRSCSSSSPSSSRRQKMCVFFSGFEEKAALMSLRFLFFCGCLWRISLPPLFGYLSFSLSLKHALLFLHTFPDAHSHSHLKHTNTIIMSSAVSSSYLALVSLYLFFFLLSHSFSLSGMCCWCFMIPPGFYLLQNNNQSVTIHTPERVLHRVKQKLTTLL